MKLIIAGSRTLNPKFGFIEGAVNMLIPGSYLSVKEVVCGMAPGVDDCGLKWALLHGKSLIEFPADWEAHGKAAGPIRNKEMAQYGDALLLIWDGKSRGSANMKLEMEKLGKPVYEVVVKSPS